MSKKPCIYIDTLDDNDKFGSDIVLYIQKLNKECIKKNDKIPKYLPLNHFFQIPKKNHTSICFLL